MSLKVFLVGISLAILGQTFGKTVSWWGTDPPSTEIPWTTWPEEQTTAAQTTQEPEVTTSIGTTTNDPTLLCIDQRDGIIMHPSQCNTIIWCSFGTGVELHCPEGEIFSWKTLSCGTDNSCWGYYEGHDNNYSLESEACTRQTQTYAEHPYEFDQYVDCADLSFRSCPSDTIFRWDYQRCLPGSQITNQLQPVVADCGFWGKKAHPYLCEQYFQCKGWVPSLTSCPHGTIFHAPSNECQRGNFQTCQYARLHIGEVFMPKIEIEHDMK